MREYEKIREYEKNSRRYESIRENSRESVKVRENPENFERIQENPKIILENPRHSDKNPNEFATTRESERISKNT